MPVPSRGSKYHKRWRDQRTRKTVRHARSSKSHSQRQRSGVHSNHELLYVEPGSPWESGYVESFNSRFRDEFLSLDEFEHLRSARALTASFQRDCNKLRPHSSLGYMTPTDFASQWPASIQSAALPSLKQATAAEDIQRLTQPELS